MRDTTRTAHDDFTLGHDIPVVTFKEAQLISINMLPDSVNILQRILRDYSNTVEQARNKYEPLRDELRYEMAWLASFLDHLDEVLEMRS